MHAPSDRHRAEEIMRTDERNCSRENWRRREARVAAALVIELAVAQELELRPVKGVAVDLPMVQLDRADGLLGREEV